MAMISNIQERDGINSETAKKHHAILQQLMVSRDKTIAENLAQRELNWVNSLQHMKDILKNLYAKEVNNRTLLNSLAKR